MKPRILVAFDFGEPAGYALAWAADLNRALGCEPVHMVYAIDTRPAVVSESPAVTSMPGPAEIAGLERRMREAARAAGVEATVEVATKPQVASATILEVARRRRIELIVMGSHARRGIERLLLGSVAAHVARGAECPVTTVYHPHVARVAR